MDFYSLWLPSLHFPYLVVSSLFFRYFSQVAVVSHMAFQKNVDLKIEKVSSSPSLSALSCFFYAKISHYASLTYYHRVATQPGTHRRRRCPPTRSPLPPRHSASFTI
jgi:hypothetical protein